MDTVAPLHPFDPLLLVAIVYSILKLEEAMTQAATLGAAHWVYLVGVAVIVLTMVQRANVVVPSVAATFLVTLAWTESPVTALGSIFNASFAAAKELFNIFLVIALMTALLNSLKTLRSDIRMVEPFRAVMKNGHAAYFVLAAITYVISLFFWPTPAVPLVSAEAFRRSPGHWQSLSQVRAWPSLPIT
jgi:hypothetical protein